MTQKSVSSPFPLAYVIERLRTAEINSDPFPHYLLENLFPAEFYRSLLKHLPESSAYQNLFEITTLKLDHFRFRDQRDLGDGWTASLPDEQRVFWDEFNSWFLGPELAGAVLDSFAQPMQMRFGERESWPEVSVECQLIRHKMGFFLQPHSDANSKLVVLLIYLPPDDRARQLGTSIYRPRDPDFVCPESAHHPFENFVKVKTAPFLANSLLAFERSDRSFHGVEPLVDQRFSNCNRDLIQYVLYDKKAREAQLNARRLAQKQEAVQ